MTTYTTIPNTDIDQDSPITQPLMTALRDNPIATAEGATGAPVLSAGWHPYDMVNVGDGNDGVFYDHSIDGTVATFETPNFADGFEYAVFLQDIDGSSITQGDLTLEMYFETAAAYGSSVVIDSTFLNGGRSYWIGPGTPQRLTSETHTVEIHLSVAVSRSSSNATAQKIGKYRFDISNANFDGGKAYLFRRREFISG